MHYLPESEIDPGRVRMARLFNEVTLHDTRVYQRIGGVPFQTLHIPWLNIRVNTRKLLRGELDVREVDVVQPTLRLCQRPDGTWNLQGLLADPWPGPWLDKTPPIVIREWDDRAGPSGRRPDGSGRRGGSGPRGAGGPLAGGAASRRSSTR